LFVLGPKIKAAFFLQLLNGIGKAISVGAGRVSKSCFFRVLLPKKENRKWILSKLIF